MTMNEQMRDNPLPLLLISAGIGLVATRVWRDVGTQGGSYRYRGYDRSFSTTPDMMSSVRDTVSDTYSAASESVSEMADLASDYSRRARSGLSMLATEQPLVLGALGLLAGAALAAMLPRTQIEDEYVGSAARQVRDQASDMASETFERAKSAVSKAADVVQQEFAGEEGRDRPGSGASGGPSQVGASSSAGSAAPSGASSMGVTSGAGGARPSESISGGPGHPGRRS